METCIILQTIKTIISYTRGIAKIPNAVITETKLELLSDKHARDRLREACEVHTLELHARRKLGGHMTRAQRVYCDGEG